MKDTSGYRLPEPYEYEGIIGEGGGGIVIKAYDTELQKYVVLKKLKKQLKKGEGRTEVDILKNLNHQYLPAVHGYKSFDGAEYTVMDYVSGKSIGSMLTEGYKFTEKEVVKYAIQLCTALDYLHSRKIPVIHGDIKPHNIMISEDGDIRLIDFNISGVSADGVGYSMGYTPGYGAPEQIAEFNDKVAARKKKAKESPDEVSDEYDDDTVADDFADDDTIADEAGFEMSGPESSADKPEDTHSAKIKITKRSDIFSVGATLYHMCTGEKLDPDSKAKTVEGFGEGIVSIINKAISKDPAKRYRDAGEMLAALLNIHKGDRRYKALQRRHFIIRAAVVLVGILGVYFVYAGRLKIEAEQDEKYSEYITQLSVETDDVSFDRIYEDAVSLKPDVIDAYILKASRLFEQGDFGGCIEYTEKVIDYHDFYEVERLSEMYYLLGNSYFETGDYKNAEESLLRSLEYDANNDNVNADLAIVYAREGKISDAEKSLDKVIALGTDNIHISLVRGEIALAGADYDKSVEFFAEYIGLTDLDYEKMRAYVLIDEAYLRKGNSTDIVNARIRYLSEAATKVSLENRLMILSRLSQAYIDGATLEPDEGYEEKAIKVMNEIITMGWANQSTYNTIIILAVRIKDYQVAEQYIKQMDERYPDNYQTYKRAALLELEVQGSVTEDDRDYSVFMEYYIKATELYNKQKTNSDSEMQLLNNYYRQLVEGNWLNE